MRRMIESAAAFMLLFAAIGFARAQSTPETLAAAREMVEAARAHEQTKAVLPLLMQQLKPAITQGRPEVERDYDLLAPAMLDAFSQNSTSLFESIAGVYARHFTAEEMAQLTTFYRSPVGQKFIEKMPLVAQESMLIGQQFGKQVAQDLLNRMRDELRKRGHNI